MIISIIELFYNVQKETKHREDGLKKTREAERNQRARIAQNPILKQNYDRLNRERYDKILRIKKEFFEEMHKSKGKENRVWQRN